MAIAEPDVRVAEEIFVAEFTLSVGGQGQGADGIAEGFLRDLEAEFGRQQPSLSLLYECRIEELRVWTGSRKSRNRLRLTLRGGKAGSLGRRFMKLLTAAALALKIISVDYGQIEENFDKAYTIVEQRYQDMYRKEKRDIRVEDIDVFVQEHDPSSPPEDPL